MVFSYRCKEENACRVLEELRGKYLGGRFEGLKAELFEDGAGVEFFRQAVQKLEGLDLLVNNAGVTILENIFDLTEKNMDYLYCLLFRNYVILMREGGQKLFLFVRRLRIVKGRILYRSLPEVAIVVEKEFSWGTLRKEDAPRVFLC